MGCCEGCECSGSKSDTIDGKFMRRREEAERRDKLRRQEDDRLREARWTVKGLDDHIMVLADETRFDLSPPIGRRSFKNFNPAIEQLVEAQLKEHRESGKRAEKRRAKIEAEAEEEEQQTKAVSDVDMALRMSGMRSVTPAKRKAV